MQTGPTHRSGSDAPTADPGESRPHRASAAGLAAMADLVTPLAIRAAATIGLFQHIGAHAPTPMSGIGAALGVDQGGAERLVRFLLARQLLDHTDRGLLLTELSEPLAVPGNWSERLNADGAAGHLDRRFAEDLLDVIRTGRRRRDVWAELADAPALGASFDNLMQTRSPEWIDAVVADDLWSSRSTVVDLAGGRGHLLAALLTRWPQLRGAIVERPGPAADARVELAPFGDRVSVAVGDLPAPLPSSAQGAAAYLLAHVLHDWDDDTAIAILSNAAAASGPDGRVIVIERVLGAAGDDQQETTHQDLRLFVLFGGRERTLEEFTDLGAAAGLTLTEARATASTRRLLVFRPSAGPEERRAAPSTDLDPDGPHDAG